jgi:hypothetical protein
MRRIRPTHGVALLSIALAIVALLIAPVGVFSGSSPAVVSSASAKGAAHEGTVSAAEGMAGARPGIAVTAGARVYQTLSSPFVGVQQDARIAADPVNGTVYAISTASSLLTAYNGTTGALLRSILLSNDTTDAVGTDIALDNLSGNLYVSMYSDTPAGVDGFLAVLQASTFHWVANISFASSTVPNFFPYRELFDYRTNQLLVENYSTQDVFAVNVTSNTIATFLPIGCYGSAPLGCTSEWGMFWMDAAIVGWIAIVPSGSSYCVSIDVAADLALDTVAEGINGTLNGFLMGPGVFSNLTNDTYFLNASGNGTLAAYNQSGTYFGFASEGAAIPLALVSDPATGWLVLAAENETLPGDQLYGISPVTGLVYWVTDNGSLPWYNGITDLAVFDASNGTGYLTTSGADSTSAAELLLLPAVGPPYAVVVTTYQSTPQDSFSIASDPDTGLFYEVDSEPNELVAVDETTGAIAWIVPFPGGDEGEWVTVDATAAAVYVAGAGGVWAYSATTGASLGTLSLPFSPQYDAIGFGQLLYLTDTANETIQVYSVASGPGTFTWFATLQLAADSDPCSLAASPVAEVAVDLSCGLGPIAQIDTVAAHGTVLNVSGSPDGYAADFNATGALFVGNDTDGAFGVQVYSAGTWAKASLLPSPVAVEFLDFDPLLNAVLVGNYSAGPAGPLALLNATTGAVLATFHTPGELGYLAVDPTSGALGATTTSDETFLANLLATPSAASGLAAHGGNTTLNVSWSAATGPSGYPVTSYDVYTSSSASGPWTSAGTSTTTSSTVTGLTDGTTYYATVRAVGGSGTGPSATPVSGVPLGVPYPPSAVTTGATTTSSIALTWQAPSNTGGAAITGYTVLYATSSSGPWTSDAAGTATSATVSSLSSGTTYYFEVEAANSVGTSHPSASANAPTTHSGSNGLLGSGSGGSNWLWIGIAVVVIIVVIAAVALLMMRKGKTGSAGSSGPGTPPTGATGGPESPPAPPPGAA